MYTYVPVESLTDAKRCAHFSMSVVYFMEGNTMPHWQCFLQRCWLCALFTVLFSCVFDCIIAFFRQFKYKCFEHCQCVI